MQDAECSEIKNKQSALLLIYLLVESALFCEAVGTNIAAYKTSMMKLLFILFLLSSVKTSYSQDSALLYYIPADARTHSAVDLESISLYAEPYVIRDVNKVRMLEAIFKDSLGEKYAGKIYNIHKYDARIVLNIYQKNKLIKYYIIPSGGHELIIMKKYFVIKDFSALLCFIKLNFAPISQKQKGQFFFPKGICENGSVKQH